MIIIWFSRFTENAFLTQVHSDVVWEATVPGNLFIADILVLTWEGVIVQVVSMESWFSEHSNFEPRLLSNASFINEKIWDGF